MIVAIGNLRVRSRFGLVKTATSYVFLGMSFIDLGMYHTFPAEIVFFWRSKPVAIIAIQMVINSVYTSIIVLDGKKYLRKFTVCDEHHLC